MQLDRGFRSGEGLLIGVISDTHIPTRAKRVPESVIEIFQGVSAILHAGDLVDSSVLERLNEVAPTTAVSGNCDPWDIGLKGTAEVEFAGVRIGMIHDSGASSGRRERMRRTFPGCRVVVFGHSHMPIIEDDGDLMLLNPGSACEPRWAKVPTVAILEISASGPSARLETVAR